MKSDNDNLLFRTVVDVPQPARAIDALDEVVFVGSCFADSIGRRFADAHFPCTVNPFGTMYNPVSVLHTLQRMTLEPCPDRPPHFFLTLGTNHVYRRRTTGEIVDNCQKQPQRLFSEEQLSVDDCRQTLMECLTVIGQRWPGSSVVLTVSPIRYRKYGYHGSQLSKATLLLAVDAVLAAQPLPPGVVAADYFPAYELVLDELRDYRFYQPDMLHPSDQAADYIFRQLTQSWMTDRARQFLSEWEPIRQALAHRPFHPDSPQYQQFVAQARQQEQALMARYGRSVSK